MVTALRTLLSGVRPLYLINRPFQDRFNRVGVPYLLLYVRITAKSFQSLKKKNRNMRRKKQKRKRRRKRKGRESPKTRQSSKECERWKNTSCQRLSDSLWLF